MIPRNSNRGRNSSSAANAANRLQMDDFVNNNNRNNNVDDFSVQFNEDFTTNDFGGNQFTSDYTQTNFNNGDQLFNPDPAARSSASNIHSNSTSNSVDANARANPIDLNLLSSEGLDELADLPDNLSQDLTNNAPTGLSSNFASNLSSLNDRQQLSSGNRLTRSNIGSNLSDISSFGDLNDLNDANNGLDGSNIGLLTGGNSDLNFSSQSQQRRGVVHNQRNQQHQQIQSQLHSQSNQNNGFGSQKRKYEDLVASDIDLQVANNFLRQQIQTQSRNRAHTKNHSGKVNNNTNNQSHIRTQPQTQSQSQSGLIQQSSNNTRSRGSNNVVDRRPESLTDSLLFLSQSGNDESDMGSLLSNPVLNPGSMINDISQQQKPNTARNQSQQRNRSIPNSNGLLNANFGSSQTDESIWPMYDGSLNSNLNNLSTQANNTNNSNSSTVDRINNSRSTNSASLGQSAFPLTSPFFSLANDNSQPAKLIRDNDGQSASKPQQNQSLNHGRGQGTVQLQLFETSRKDSEKDNHQKQQDQINQAHSANRLNMKLPFQKTHQQHQSQAPSRSQSQQPKPQDSRQYDLYNRNTFNQNASHGPHNHHNSHSHGSTPNNNEPSPTTTPDYVQNSSHIQQIPTAQLPTGNTSHGRSPQPLISPGLDHPHHHGLVHPTSYFSPPIAPHDAELMIIRQKYKAKSSIPPDMTITNYGLQCIYAARSSRLPPFSLHPGEYNLLRPYLPVVHVTTYLNIRNGILRLWLSNPKVNVTRSEAAGCAKDDRFFNLSEVAYDWLVRNGYINFGCFEYPSLDYYNPIPEERRKPRQTIIVLGAGIAGLSCARQLDNLFQRKARHFAEYQDLPRILVLEGRRRIGGRLYTTHLKSSQENTVDMGAQFITGFGNGNPLAVVVRRQLGLPVTKMEWSSKKHDQNIKQEGNSEQEDRSKQDTEFNPSPSGLSSHTAKDFPRESGIFDSVTQLPVSSELVKRASSLFQHLLERVSQFRNAVPPPTTVDGDKVLIAKSKDPISEEFPGILTISKAEDTGRLKNKRLNDDSDYKESGNHGNHGHHHNSHHHNHNNTHHSHGHRESHSHGFGHNDFKKEFLGRIEVQFLKDIGVQLKPGVADDASIRLIPEPQGDMYPSLGISMDALLKQLQDISYISPEELRLLNWYYANLEYFHATCLDNLSLANWKHEACERLYEDSDSSESDVEGDYDDMDIRLNENKPKKAKKHLTGKFTGAPSIIKNGYINLARGLYLYPEKLDVRFKSNVKILEYSSSHSSGVSAEGGKVEVVLENGEKVKADKVVVTVPLGVLKDRTIQFIPDLPQWKQDSIERLGFGVINKVCLIYKHAFWDENQAIISIAQPHGEPEESDSPNHPRRTEDSSLNQENYRSTRGAFYAFWNVTKAVGKPCLIGVITGDSAIHLANETDEYIVSSAQKSIACVYPRVYQSELVESIVTRWQVDPFSRGSYSYVGLEATGADYDLLARPIGDALFFAGEATERKYPATVHGAYLSGLRAANEVLTSMMGEIKIPQPLVPSKNYQLSKRVQQTYNTSGVPASVVHAVASGIPGIGSSSSSASHHATPTSSMVHTPTGMGEHGYNGLGHHGEQVVYPNGHGHHAGPIPSHVSHGSSSLASPPSVSGYKRKASHEETATEARLRLLREERQQVDNERMRSDMVKELGERPMKPERSGANPFLIFQKDFWDICRQQCDSEKQRTSGDSHARAARNEVRAALGKMWRELPEAEKEPYLLKTKDIKEVNNKKTEEYKEKVRRYETDADDFKKKWKEQKASKPSEEESQLTKFLQEEKLQEKKQLKQQMNNHADHSKNHSSHGAGSHSSQSSYGQNRANTYSSYNHSDANHKVMSTAGVLGDLGNTSVPGSHNGSGQGSANASATGSKINSPQGHA